MSHLNSLFGTYSSPEKMDQIEEEVHGAFRDCSPMPPARPSDANVGHNSLSLSNTTWPSASGTTDATTSTTFTTSSSTRTSIKTASPPSPSPVSAPIPMPTQEIPEMSYEEITNELSALMDAANEGADFDENRLDFLLQKQRESPEYHMMQLQELAKWQAVNFVFLSESLDITRSFVPPTVFTDNLESLQSYGLSTDISKRILQKQCLWLVRLDPGVISRLHESDLYHRYQFNLLDIVELAACYAVLPDVFLNDSMGKKLEWKETMYDTLKRRMAERDRNCLPKGKLRAACYETYFASGAAANPVVSSPVRATDTTGAVIPSLVSSPSSPPPTDLSPPAPPVPVSAPVVKSTMTSMFGQMSVTDEKQADETTAAAAITAAVSAPLLSSRHRRNTVGTCSSASAPSVSAGAVELAAALTPSSAAATTRVPFSEGTGAMEGESTVNSNRSPSKPTRAPAVTPRKLGFGPITDLTTLHEAEVIKAASAFAPRRSFTETCGQYSILSKMKRKSSI